MRALLFAAVIALAAPAAAQDARPPAVSRRNGEAPPQVLSREAAYHLRVLRTSADPAARVASALALGREHDTLVLAALITVVLGDPEPRVRAAAATSLGTLGDRQAIDVLEEASHDRDATVARAASDALAALRARR